MRTMFALCVGLVVLLTGFWAYQENYRTRQTLADLALASGTTPSARYRPPPSGRAKSRIYANKMMTRIAGRYAPRIDTTIHTLKS